MSVEAKADSEQERLEAWRLRCLLEAGWALHRAELLAARTEVDLHVAVDLLHHGCDQHLGLKILL